MKAHSLIVITSLLAAVLLVSVDGLKSHNFTVGYRLPGDRLVMQQAVEVKSKFLQIVTLQKTFNASRFDRITKVEAIDSRNDGTGAIVSLLQGGPGYNNVTLRFKSQRNHGIHFLVNLYARW